MGEKVFSEADYTSAAEKATEATGSATERGEQEVIETGKLNPLVDPSEYGVIRRSLPRLKPPANRSKKKLWTLLVGPPLPIETRLDTTGSMGGNVDIALRVLPNMYTACAAAAPGYDLQIATGIFNDVCDPFVLCRPQFEMHAEKIVEQLSLMVPHRSGGDTPEDPHYGLFGAAYLTDAHIVKLGLKGYDFTVSDAPARDRLSEKQLMRIFGPQVFEKAKENGFDISVKDLPSTTEVVASLLDRAHAFFLQIDNSSSTRHFWEGVFSAERVIPIPKTDYVPQVQAAIIGLTEGTLDLGNCEEFLRGQNVPEEFAKKIVQSLSKIPLGAQAQLPNFPRLPVKGDKFETKTSLWPVGATTEVDSSDETDETEDDDKIVWK